MRTEMRSRVKRYTLFHVDLEELEIELPQPLEDLEQGMEEFEKETPKTGEAAA
jgi:hypothetical protein